jgi:hypothetical protein
MTSTLHTWWIVLSSSLTILNLKELYSILITTRINVTQSVMSLAQMDAYLEEELYDDLTYSIQNPKGSDFESKKKRIEEIGRELYADGGTDAMENMFYSIEFRIKEEIGKDARSYRSWWNNISPEWKY